MEFNILFGEIQIADWIINIAFQATIVLTISLLIRRLCKRCSAPTRSDICLITLFLLLVLPFGALVSVQIEPTRIEILPQKTEVMNRIDKSLENSANTPLVLALPQVVKTKQEQKKITSDFITYKNLLSRTNLIQLVIAFGTIWFIGILVLLVRLGHGLTYIYKIKPELAKLENPRLVAALKPVMAVFGKKKPPAIYTSSLINIPQTAGLFKPCVILPVNTCQEMNDEELKSILLHEMSHIYHKDHWIGLVQRVVIALFWWNPLVYSLSSNLSEEREHICDNYAINYVRPMVFAKCLLNLAKNAQNFRQLPVALCVGTSKSTLENRVKSIISGGRTLETKTKKRTFMARIVISLLMLGILFSFSWTMAAQKGLEKTATFSFLTNPHLMDIDERNIYIAEDKEIFVIDRTSYKLIKKMRNIGIGKRTGTRIRHMAIKGDNIVVTKKNDTTLYDKNTGMLKSRYSNWNYPLSKVFPFGEKLVKLSWEYPKGVIDLCDSKLENCKRIFEKSHLENLPWNPDTKKANFFTTSWGVDADNGQLIVAIEKEFIILRFDKNGERLPDIVRDYPNRVPVTPEFIENFQEMSKTRYTADHDDLISQGWNYEYPEYLPAILDITISDGKIYAGTFRTKNNKSETFIFDLNGHFIEKRYITIKHPWPNTNYGPIAIKEEKIHQLAYEDQKWSLYVSDIKE